MRKLMMAGAFVAAALLARDVRAEEAAKERKEAWDATKAEVKQDSKEAKADVKEAAADVKQESKEAAADVKQESKEAAADVKQESKEAAADVKQESSEAKAKVEQGTEKARDRMHDRTAKNDGKMHHPMFEGKDNFEVKGKIQKVSMNSITVAREELPAATLNVSKSTKIEIGGEQASMKQLRAGQEVKASFNLQGSKPEAVEIKAEKLGK